MIGSKCFTKVDKTNGATKCFTSMKREKNPASIPNRRTLWLLPLHYFNNRVHFLSITLRT